MATFGSPPDPSSGPAAPIVPVIPPSNDAVDTTSSIASTELPNRSEFGSVPALPTPPAAALESPPAVLQTNLPISTNLGLDSARAADYWRRLDSLAEEAGDATKIDPMIKGISSVIIQQAVQRYRSNSIGFGFVPLPPGSQLMELLERRPILVFAILGMAYVDAAMHLQLRIARQFWKFGLNRVVCGFRSLDMLQGFLVLIASHHRYMNNKTQSLNMCFRFCVGIAEDMGLDNRPPARGSESANEREGKRLYLGCYYLATWFGAYGLSKLSIPTSATIKRYAIELETTNEYETDKVLPTVVHLCSVVQSIVGVFGTGPMSIAAMKWHANYFRNLLDLSAHNYTPQLGACRELELMHLAAHMYLLRKLISTELSDRDSGLDTTGGQTLFRIECLEATRRFLTRFSELTTGHYAHIPLVEWTHLLFAFSTLAYIHSIAPHDSSQNSPFQTFCTWQSTMCSHFPPTVEGQESDEDMFARFRRVTNAMLSEMRPPQTTSPTSRFAIASGSRQPVSILHDAPSLPPLLFSGPSTSGTSLPSIQESTRNIDLKSESLTWKLLTGDI